MVVMAVLKVILVFRFGPNWTLFLYPKFEQADLHNCLKQDLKNVLNEDFHNDLHEELQHDLLY